MKSTLYLIMLLTAGLLLAACAKDEAPVNDVVDLKFSAILAAKEPAAKSVDAEGNTTWEVGEKIAIYYQKTDDSFDMAEARVDAVDGGAALVSAHLSDAKDHSGVKFVYPYSLANSTGDLLAERFLSQHGTMADISDHFDAATGTGTLVIDGSSCSTDGPVHLYNQAFIGKFTPQSGGSPIDGITLLTITAGTRTYTVTPSEGTFGTSGIYVAMLPVSSQKVALTVHTASRHYHYAGVTATFEAGKLYKSLSVPMTESKVINLSEVTGNTTAGYGDILTGTLGGNYKISVADGATVTLQNVTISCDGARHNWIRGVVGNLDNIDFFVRHYKDKIPNLKISYTYSKYNEDCVDEDMEMFRNWGFDKVYLCIASQMDLLDNSKHLEFVPSSLDGLRNNMKMFYDKDREYLDRIFNRWHKKKCDSTYTVFTIYTNGDVVRCQSYLSKEVLGNINIDRFSDIVREVENIKHIFTCRFDRKCGLLCQRRYD